MRRPVWQRIDRVPALPRPCALLVPHQRQVDARATADGVPEAEARRRLLAEKQPSLQFTTHEQLGELAVFLCSPAGDNIRGTAFNIDGGWAAQ